MTYQVDTEYGCSATIIADSFNDHGVRLTTAELVFPRYILPEVNTHRAISKNASSGRAIPLAKQIARVEENPVMFFNPGYNQPGMQAAEPLSVEDRARVGEAWLKARDAALEAAQVFADVGLHKQHASRVLEPWLWQKIVATTTDVDNFMRQRISDLAQPEIDLLAKLWKNALDDSDSQHIPFGSYHLPYVTDEEKVEYRDELLIKFSIARCARTSYLTPQGEYDIEKDVNLHERLVTASPPHWSPCEHVATPAHTANTYGGNFRSWIQMRQILEATTN